MKNRLSKVHLLPRAQCFTRGALGSGQPGGAGQFHTGIRLLQGQCGHTLSSFYVPKFDQFIGATAEQYLTVR